MDQPLKPEDMKIDSAKFKQVIEKMKSDRNFASDVHKLVTTNEKIRRNATNIAREMPRTCGQDVPLNERKKMQKQQDLARHFAMRSTPKGDVQCIMIPQKGSASSLSSYTFNPEEMDDDKWALQGATVGGTAFVAILNSTILTGSLNKTASRLLAMDARGPVIFMLLNEEYSPVDIDVGLFKILMSK